MMLFAEHLLLKPGVTLFAGSRINYAEMTTCHKVVIKHVDSMAGRSVEVAVLDAHDPWVIENIRMEDGRMLKTYLVREGFLSDDSDNVMPLA